MMSALDLILIGNGQIWELMCSDCLSNISSINTLIIR